MSNANHKFSLFILIAIALVGAVRLLFATSVWGIGIDSDGVVFLSGAQNLLRGKGLQALLDGTLAPLTHFPPLYPLLLAAVKTTDLTSLAGARWLNICLFAANITLLGAVTQAYTPHARWLAVMVAGLLALSPDMILIHIVALTEPIFLFTTFLGLFALTKHLERPTWPRLLLAASATSLAFLARYPGIVCVLTGAIALLLWSHTSYSKRIRDTALFLCISCLPMAMWVLRNALVAGTATNRTIVVHPLTTGHIQSFFYTLSTWLLPYSRLYPLDPGIRILLMAVIGSTIVSVYRWLSRNTQNTEDVFEWLRRPIHQPLAVLGTFVGIYIGFVAFSISLFDLSTPLDHRILLPVHIAVVMLVACALHYALHSLEQKTKPHYVFASLWGILMLLSLISSQEFLHTFHTYGWGYSGKAWQKSAIIAEIRTLPVETRIYTNAPDAVYLHTGRVIPILPYKIERTSRLPRGATYTTELAAIQTDVVQNGAVIAYFSTITWRDYLPSEKELRQEMALVPFVEGWDGTIYAGQEPEMNTDEHR